MEKFFYRVQTGDTVIGLSAKFNVPPVKIITDNALTGEIEDGDVLFIEETLGTVYMVKPFDTVESVAERFHVLPELLKEINGVDYLFYGLKIIIPND